MVTKLREPSIRRWSQKLAASGRYPAMYRLLSGLPLCAGCLEALPVIGDLICRQCGREREGKWAQNERCLDCLNVADEPLESNRSLLRYTNWGKDLLGMYKYRGDERLAAFFSGILAVAVLRYYSCEKLDGITTVPLHGHRLQQRGFNQVDLLASRLGKIIGVPVHSLLRRTRETPKLSQQGGRFARQESMQGAFSWAGENGESLAGRRHSRTKTVLLLDDIYTTGSTLRECASVLRSHVGTQSRILSLTIYR